jgi:hypothetical protein
MNANKTTTSGDGRDLLLMPALGVLALILVASMALQARADDGQAAYRTMAPLDEYLMTDQEAEIALARSAAPAPISREATILVLQRQGYETVVKGKNGFACIVERAWMSNYDDSQFWNPKMRGPVCFNPAAARSILPITLKRTAMVLAGLSKEQMIDETKVALQSKALPALEPGAMCYMMSRQGYLNDSVGHWVPHLMFYVPKAMRSTWGSDFPGSPVMTNSQFQSTPEPVTVFMVPVGQWSDGVAAPVH